MSDVWVTNASPVIALAKAGHLDLLTRLPTELLLPDPVATEILAGPAADPARQAVEGGWGRRVVPVAIPAELTEWGLDAGETAALAIAQERAPCTSYWTMRPRGPAPERVACHSWGHWASSSEPRGAASSRMPPVSSAPCEALDFISTIVPSVLRSDMLAKPGDGGY